MKAFILALLLLFALPLRADEEKVSVPKSMLTGEQLKKLETATTARDWVGIGKEVGEAVNSSLQAINTQTNTFAQTRVGKLTMFLVVWRIMGDMLLHVLFGILLLVIFIPLWIWSYRKTCMTYSIKTGKDTYEKVVYDKSKYDEVTPRAVHFVAAIVLLFIVLVTVFTY